MKTTITLITTLFFLTTAFGQTRKDSLLVFVGEKIEVKSFPQENNGLIIDTIIKGKDTSYTKRHSMDSRYMATYRVIQWLNGIHVSDTIQFIVFDHYGQPAFSQYQTVLLFVSNFKGKLYHEKYQYYDVYLTTDNKWASPYPSGDYNHTYKDNITVKPEKISFKGKIVFLVDQLSEEEIQTRFPKPYYDIKDGKAIPIYGNYVEDLFKLKQQTILKARGIY